MAYKDKERGCEVHRQWRMRNPEKVREYGRRWLTENLEKAHEIARQSRARNTGKIQERDRQWRAKQRELIFGHYGKACTGCGETELVCLSIDHINGGGNKHRREVGEGSAFYRWLIKNNFPEGFRTLCMNCQFRAKAGVPLPNERMEKSA